MEQQNEKNYIEKSHFHFIMFLHTLLIITSILIIFFLINSKIDRIELGKSDNLPVFENNVEDNTEKTYTLKEYNGKIGIFENNSLVYTLDTYIFTLPENDKKLLNDGISVSTKEELLVLLEEYY